MKFGDLQFLVVLINLGWRSCIMSCSKQLNLILWQLILLCLILPNPIMRGYLFSRKLPSWNILMPQQTTAPTSLYACRQWRYAMCVHVCMCKFFSSVTDPRHSCLRQLQRHITMPACSLPKPYSQIPRFPQPSFPNWPRISVSCSWMTDGFPWESSMWVFCFTLITLSCFKSWCFWQKPFSLFMLHS